MIVLLAAALVILGPERLPGAIRWTTGAMRRIREYADEATGQVRQEFGTEFDELREPLRRLDELRAMTPRSALTKFLLDGDDSVLTGKFEGVSEPTTPHLTPEDIAPHLPNPGPATNCGSFDAIRPHGETVPPIDPDAT
ncbi:Sec-independent protein translocase protein TatB [Nocardia vinacea]|uniref:Sec-independent protein translocase protein TatB n=1 Tax=Nocardia vinacea TaxID=96468 RepID=UPI000593F81B